MKKLYKPMKAQLLEIGGLFPSMTAMRLPFDGGVSDSISNAYEFTLGKKDAKRAKTLILLGDEHAKCIRGIDAWIKVEMQIGVMIEFVTYHIGVDDLSTSSSMHNELVKLKNDELAEEKQAGLSTKMYTRIFKSNYQALRRIYKQRRSHRHPDWQYFCDFIEALPYFKEFIYPEFVESM